MFLTRAAFIASFSVIQFAFTKTLIEEAVRLEKQRLPNSSDYSLSSLLKNPDAHVCNDGSGGRAVCDRILSAVGDPVGQADASRCQESARQRDAGSGRIAACATCNEALNEC
ncbi:hypothetical protein ACHHYP_17439 [Achlya hypogyna]|uniref:Secreted protein n=1 Tax=Achlya hypogyna TaxID=1202772 RepID=A0A0A7CPS4_ACHHY|nr:secreted protein [Achlya hypogyna]OQR80598.1 hypothetical protein ACHHYP_17439 [Achlya hypogyna]